MKSIFNRGTSTAYKGVSFYAGTNFGGTFLGCIGQNNGYSESATGVYIRSHQWTRTC
ncbi:hypothetical protein GCM10027075_61240 [Streptomyces heilongjiangensis]